MMSQRGFTMLELVTVIAIIGILIAAALPRFLPLIDEAERVSVLQLEGQLRATLMTEAAQRIVRGQAATIAELDGSNPIDLLMEPPGNYLGELVNAEYEEVEKRHWYFAHETKRLVYRLGDPVTGGHETDEGHAPAFVVRVAYRDNDGDGVFDANVDELYGVRLERLSGAAWLDTPLAN